MSRAGGAGGVQGVFLGPLPLFWKGGSWAGNQEAGAQGHALGFNQTDRHGHIGVVTHRPQRGTLLFSVPGLPARREGGVCRKPDLGRREGFLSVPVNLLISVPSVSVSLSPSLPCPPPPPCPRTLGLIERQAVLCRVARWGRNPTRGVTPGVGGNTSEQWKVGEGPAVSWHTEPPIVFWAHTWVCCQRCRGWWPAGCGRAGGPSP